MPHHIIQRGNRRQQTFFNDEDYQTYLELMTEGCLKYQVEIWAYCLMSNHVHLIAVPAVKERLSPPSEKRTDVIQGRLISGKDGVGIYGREGFRLLLWKKGIY